MAAMLGEVPADLGRDTEDDLLLQTADLVAATEAAGLDRPPSGSRESVTPWLQGLAGLDGVDSTVSPVFVPMASTFQTTTSTPEEFAEVAGWSLLDVDRFVEQATPPITFAVVHGDLDGALADDLVDVDDDVVSDREGADLRSDLAGRNALSPIGVPVRFAQVDGRVAVSTSTPAVRAWLDGAPTLADDEALVEVAEALDDEDVLSAVIARRGGGTGGATAPFDVVGLGWAVDAGRPVVHAAYRFTSAEDAEAGVALLETTYRDGVSVVTRSRFSDRFTVVATEVRGSVAVVSVTPTDDGRVDDLFEALVRRDAVFAPPG